MKSYLKMAIPLAVVLGFGMASAQLVAPGVKEKLRVKTVTVDDGTLYPQAPKKGGSVTFDKGEVSYEVCDGAVCADSADFFNSTYYYWERYDINDTTWKNYAAYSKDTTFVPGEYRLVARYIRNKWTVSTVASVADRREAQERRDADFAQHSVQEVRVNGIKFDRLSCETYSLTVRSPRWRCYYTSPTITVGKSKPIVFKPICSDGTDKCGAEYSGPTKSFDGDSVKFTVKNTNQDYGWGMAPVCEEKDGWCYLASLFSAMILPVNSTVTDDMESLYGTSKISASLSLASESEIANAFDGGFSYVYLDTTEHADTVYYPLTLRNIDINYEKADHGTVTGPAKAHDGELMFLSIVPEDGYDLDTVYSRGMDSNNVMQYNYVPPTVGELMSDGSRYALFMAQDGFEQNITAEFHKVGQEVTMVKPTNGTYSVTSRGKEHNASEKLFLTNAAGSTISVKPTPDAGYAVKTVTCEYETKENGVETMALSKNATTGLYNCSIPDTSALSEDILNRTKQIMVKVEFAKVNDIKLDVTGLGTIIAYVYGAYDPANGEGPYCSNAVSDDTTNDAGKACTALEGDSIVIDVEAYDGHPLKSMTCKIDGKTSENCIDSKAFKMLDKDAEIKAVFKATEYELTKTGVVDDFELYVGWASKTAATSAHQFDTVFVRSADNKHIAIPTGWRGVYMYDSAAGIHVPYFIMGAADVEVEVTEESLRKTVKQTIKINGQGYVYTYNSLIGYNLQISLSTADSNEMSIRAVTNTQHTISIYPADGYSYVDTTGTKCTYKDGSEIPLDMQSNYVSYVLNKEKDFTCEVTFTPNSYTITATADDNGVLQNVPKKGNTDAEISFKAAPLAGYEVDFVKAYYMDKDSTDKDVAVLLDMTDSYDKTKNVYTYKFTMPARDVSIEAAFKEIKSSSSSAKSSSSSAKSSSSSAKSSSSSVKAKSSSSSAKAKSSSSSAKAKSSSSSAKSKSSSSKGGKKDALPAYAQAPLFSLTVMGRSVQVAGATVGSAYSVLDMQGKVIASGVIDAANVNMAMPHAGTFLVRIGSQTQTANVK